MMSTARLLRTLTADIVSHYLMKTPLDHALLPKLIQDVHAALADAAAGPARPRGPAVPVRESVQQDHIVCLEDGKKLRTLRRHLERTYGLTPAQYRARWGLPEDYPMVAPGLSERRSRIARTQGLGTSVQNRRGRR